MIGVALKGLLGRKLRAILTAFAIVLGVAMISGSFVLTDTLGKSFDGIYEESYKATDAVISSKVAIEHRRRRRRGSGLLGQRARRGRARCPASASRRARSRTRSRLVDKAGKPIGSRRRHRARRRQPTATRASTRSSSSTATWPQRRRTRSRSTSRPPTKQQLRGRPDRRRLRRRPGPEVPRSAGSSASASRRLARRRHDLRLRPRRPPSGCSTSTGKLDLIRVGAEPGVVGDGADAPDPAAPLRDDAGEDGRRRRRPRTASETQQGLSIIKYFLLGFGGIALFVGSFVIANTLAITVAQRMRELATLRTLGASRRQVLGSVVLESLVDRAHRLRRRPVPRARRSPSGLKALARGDGIELPSGGLVFSPRTIIVSLAVGTLIALAGEPPSGDPGDADRADRGGPRGRSPAGVAVRAVRSCRRRSPSSRVAVGLFSYGVFASGLDVMVADRSRSSPACCSCSSASRWSPHASCARWRYVLGAPGARFGGTAGRLARQNAVRNPSRTASTAAAVMIGLALITFVAVHRPGRPHLVHGRGQRALHRRLRVTTADAEPADEQGGRGAASRCPASSRLGDPLRRGQGRAARTSSSPASTPTCRRPST